MMPPREDTDEHEGAIELIGAERIRPEAVDWIWRDHLANGKLTLLAGAPGTGKTTIALKMAATISAGGLWPDGSRADAGTVVIWSGEDDQADTLVPRLIAADADLSRIQFVGSVRVEDRCREFDPAKDMPHLTAALFHLTDLRLLIVDPLVSAVAGDSHKNAEVRRSLQPLVNVAALNNCGLLGITHFSKGTAGREPIERITGSLAFGALARIVLVAAKPQVSEDGSQPARILLRAKSNIGRDHGGFEYELREKPLADKPEIVASYVEWKGMLDGSARTLLARAEEADAGAGGAKQEAREFLLDVLSSGAMLAREILHQAQAAGISRATLLRAKNALGIKPRKTGLKEGWAWELPRRYSRPAEDPHSPNVSTFRFLRETIDDDAT